MIEMKTAQLIGPALDWAVAKAEGYDEGWLLRQMNNPNPATRAIPAYSTDWGQGGPLIERLAGFQLKIWLESSPGTKCEAAIHDYKGDWIVFGPTPLIAAMRCLVAAKLGDTVQIPSELIQ